MMTQFGIMEQFCCSKCDFTSNLSRAVKTHQAKNICGKTIKRKNLTKHFKTMKQESCAEKLKKALALEISNLKQELSKEKGTETSKLERVDLDPAEEREPSDLEIVGEDSHQDCIQEPDDPDDPEEQQTQTETETNVSDMTNYFMCKQCDFKSRIKRQVKKHNISCHILTRTGEHVCEECKKSFKRKIVMKNHIDEQHKKYCFFCNICDYNTGRKSYMKTHKRKMHSMKDKSDCYKYPLPPVPVLSMNKSETIGWFPQFFSVLLDDVGKEKMPEWIRDMESVLDLQQVNWKIAQTVHLSGL